MQQLLQPLLPCQHCPLASQQVSSTQQTWSSRVVDAQRRIICGFVAKQGIWAAAAAELRVSLDTSHYLDQADTYVTGHTDCDKLDVGVKLSKFW
jgi:hypothetical protein